MFKIDREYIKQNSSGYSFDRGLEYHFGNRVRAIQYNPNRRGFTATVHDLKERNVSVAFDADGRLANSQCSCRLPGKPSTSFCEHLVAVLLLIVQRDGEGFFSQLKDREKAKRVFDLFSYQQIGARGGAGGAIGGGGIAGGVRGGASRGSGGMGGAADGAIGGGGNTADGWAGGGNAADGWPGGIAGSGVTRSGAAGRAASGGSASGRSFGTVGDVANTPIYAGMFGEANVSPFGDSFGDANESPYGDVRGGPAQLEAIYVLPPPGGHANDSGYPDYIPAAGAKLRGDTGLRTGYDIMNSRAQRYESILSVLPERSSRFFFRLKCGGSSYLIKKIGRFTIALNKNRPFDFSKKFSFDPSVHTFDSLSAEVGEFLAELLEASANYNSLLGLNEYSLNTSIFEDRYLCLTDRQMRRLFNMHAKNGGAIHVCQGTAIFEARILDENAPLFFCLERDDNDFLLKIGAGADLIPLTGEGDLLYRQGAIYRLQKPQAEIMRPFLKLLDGNQENDFRFISEDRNRFVSEVLPLIDKIGSLTIDEDVSSIIDKKPIVADVYLDRESSLVSADVRFRYGETEINPFASAQKAKAEKPDDRIVVRDVAYENAILDILAEADFKVKNGKINLYEDDSIFTFCADILPKLQKYADIYYSQEFRKLSIKRNIGFRANLSFNMAGGGLAELLAFEFDTDLIDRGELLDVIRSIREKKRYYKLKTGALLDIGGRETLDAIRLLELLEARDEDVVSGQMSMPRYKALFLDSYLRNSELHNIGRDKIFREFIDALSEPAESEYAPPDSVARVLRDYQRTGFKWLKALSAYALGGILADDMGLGKTLQVLVLLLSLREDGEAGGTAGGTAGVALVADTAYIAGQAPPSLIVAPTSLIYNWCAEIEKFTPGLRYIAIYGGKAERARLIASIPGHDVIITSYPLIRRDYEIYRQMEFNYIILDEAQYIKNPDSQNAISVKCLKARSRFALTGTPIENRLLDLWSIFDFILPGYLSTAKSFNEKYAVAHASGMPDIYRRMTGGVDEYDVAEETAAADTKNIEIDSAVNIEPNAGAKADTNTSAKAASNAESNTAVTATASEATEASGQAAEAAPGPHYDEPASNAPQSAMPSGPLDLLSAQIKPFILRRLKSDVLRELPDKIDMRMHAQMTEEQKVLYLAYLEKIRAQINSEISENGFEKSQFVILAALTRLRQICCHPGLFVEGYRGDSGKFMLLQELTREALEGGHRILLFSQFTEMLALIKKWADREKIGYHYIDGNVKAFERHRLINEFNGGAGDMFLLSLKAGGAGINLTGADTVIHYDPWWNPAVEDQATDRAYRIGQHKTVQVIKLLTAGSIEEKINVIQERKKQLIDAVITPGETFITKLSKADLDEILAP